MFSVGMVYRIAYNIYYLADEHDLCTISMESPKGFAVMLST